MFANGEHDGVKFNNLTYDDRPHTNLPAKKNPLKKRAEVQN